MRAMLLVAGLSITACTGGSSAPQNAPPAADIVVRTYFENLVTPAAEGVVIRVNGQDLGTTGPDGTFAATVATGTLDIHAFLSGLAGGHARIEVTGDATLDILMDGLGLFADTALELEPLVQGPLGNILDAGFGALTLRFVDPGGETAPLEDLTIIAIDPRDGGPFVHLLPFFGLEPDGTVVATDLPALRAALLAVDGEVELLVRGDDAQGLVHHGTLKFHVGRFTVTGTLAPPPSQPSLPVMAAGIPVRATLLGLDGKGVAFETSTDAAGAFVFRSVPIGSLVFDVGMTDAGLVYSSFGNLAVDSDIDIRITLLTTEDVVAGVESISVTTLTGIPMLAHAPPEDPDPSRLAADAVLRGADDAVRALAGSTIGATVSASGAAEGVSEFDVATLSVPKGTGTLTLKYVVASGEYPTYVNKQSQYDDVWLLLVMAKDGKKLFEMFRRVNAMLGSPPQWQSDGTTGEILEELDVASLTAAADTEVTVFVTSTNVGDSSLSIMVTATLSFQPEFRITGIRPDKVPVVRMSKCHKPGEVLDSDYYSMPRFAESNVLHRFFTLTLAGRPPGSAIDSVTVDLFEEGRSGNEVGILHEQHVDGESVREIDPQTLEVRVTQDIALLLPERAHAIRYRFRVVLDVAGNMVAAPPKESNRCHALWRMPPLFQRVGERDAGGDDWASRDCYAWLEKNAALVTRINDISGEHASNIGHCDHDHGTDIDMYHFTDLTGTEQPVGASNFKILRDKTIDALKACEVVGDCELQPGHPVREWFATARVRLTALATLPTVRQIYFVKGKAEGDLPAGWANTLLRKGKLTDASGRMIDLGIGTWNEAKVAPDDSHNDHVHLSLDRAALASGN